MGTNHGAELSGWVEKHTRELLSWAIHKVTDEELARDLVQDTFLAAAQSRDTFRQESTPRTYLFSILNHKIIDHYRGKLKGPQKLDAQSHARFFDEGGDWHPDQRPQAWDDADGNLLDNDAFQSVLAVCMEALPELWGTCIRMKYLMGKKGEDICQEAGISATNYWQIVHRAKLQLRSCIENNWFKEM